MKIIICQYCKKEFSPKNRVYAQKFCCKHCAGKGNVNKGRKKKGCVSWNKGLKGYNSFKRPKKWKDNISKALKIVYDIKGRKTEINKLERKSREYIEWRNGVFKRDNWTCQFCGKKSMVGGRIVLHAHHLKEFSKYKKLIYVLENGQTLCEYCHKEIHKKQYPNLILNFKDYTGNKAIKL